MRFTASSVRMLRAVSTVLVLWLLSATAAHAAPAARRGSSRPACDAQTTTLKKLRRHVRAFGGPLKKFKRHAATAGLTDTGSRMRRGAHPPRRNDDAAIQNDAPPAGVHLDDHAVPARRPIGVLHGPHDQRPRSRAFAPPSPRGPPPHA